MTVINSIGSNGMTISDPADQNLIKSTAMSTVTLSPSGGTSPYTFSVYSGTLPPGLSLGSSNGQITGTPTTAQSSANVRFQIVDDDGGAIVTGAVAFHVADTLEISNGLDSATTIEATKSTAWTYQLYNTGGRGSFTWTKATGTFPAGLSVSTAGVISGTPTATGTQVLTFTCTDANSSTATTANVSITVNDVISFTVGALTFNEETAEIQTFEATGGTEPLVFSTDDDLPPGVKLDQDGKRTCFLISNVPNGTGSASSFTIDCTDANGATDDGGLSAITINT